MAAEAPVTWLSVAEIQRNQGWTRDDIYWYARRDKWRRTKTRPRYYWSEDVTTTIEKQADTRTSAA